MKNKIITGTAFFAILFPIIALAAATPDPTSVTIIQGALKASTDTIFKDLQTWGISLLSALIAAQFVLTNLNLLKNGTDIEGVALKTLGSLFWFGFCMWIFQNGAGFMQTTVDFFFAKAGMLAGGSFTPGYPLNFGLALTNNLLVGLDNSQSILSSLNPFPSIMLGLVSVAILLISCLIAFKIFMLLAETQIVIALSPLSFALLGLDALRDQGLAPLKYLISMGYRAIILGAVLKAMGVLGTSIDAVFSSLPSLTTTSVWTPIWASVMGYALLGFFAFRADSIAAMLSSGSSQMSTGDAAAVGAVAGAAAAAAVTGGASALGGAKAAGAGGMQSMTDFMKGIKGGSGNPQSIPIPDPSALSSLIQPSGESLDSQMQAVAASEKAMATGNAGGTTGNTPADGVTSGGGDTGGVKSAPFSKADAAKAAASVGSMAGQNTKNTAAVNAAMKATGANASAAGAAEAVAARGGSAQEAVSAAAAWNASPVQQAAIYDAFAGASNVSEPGWLASGNTSSPEGAATGVNAVGDGSSAGIGGSNKNQNSSGGGYKDPSFLDRLEKLNDHVARENAQVHVTLNTQGS